MSEFLKSFYSRLLQRAMLNRSAYLVSSAMIVLIVIISATMLMLFKTYSIILLALVFPCYFVHKKTYELNSLYDGEFRVFKWSSIGNPPLSDIHIPFILCPVHGTKEIPNGCYSELKNYLENSGFNEVMEYVQNLSEANGLITYKDLCQIIIYTETKKIWFKSSANSVDAAVGGSKLFTSGA